MVDLFFFKKKKKVQEHALRCKMVQYFFLNKHLFLSLGDARRVEDYYDGSLVGEPKKSTLNTRSTPNNIKDPYITT